MESSMAEHGSVRCSIADCESSRAWTREWWLFAAGLFVHLPLDLLSTILVVGTYGVDVEANPIVQSLLASGLLYVTLAYLGATVLLVSLFSWLLSIRQRTREPYRTVLSRGITAWLIVLLGSGLFFVVNNILALLVGWTIL